jgi:hypothetical protein
MPHLNRPVRVFKFGGPTCANFPDRDFGGVAPDCAPGPSPSGRPSARSHSKQYAAKQALLVLVGVDFETNAFRSVIYLTTGAFGAEIVTGTGLLMP